MMRKLTFITIALLFISIRLYSQNINVFGVFPTIDHSGTFNDKVDYSLYYFAALPLVNLNSPDFSKDAFFHLLYLEQALNYNVSRRLSITGSYVYQRENGVADNSVEENRLYLQTKYKHSVKKVNLIYRLRYDFRQITEQSTTEMVYRQRVRLLAGFDTPVNEKLYFTAYEEAFFNTYPSSKTSYAENWAYVALGKKLNQKNKVEIGLLYVTWNLRKSSWFNQYYFQCTWINHLNFTKTNKKNYDS